MPVIAIVGGIVLLMVVGVIVVVTIANQEEEPGAVKVENGTDRELPPEKDDKLLPEIQERLDEIERKNRENEYTPKEVEWITSGPFQIDRSEYVLGEKIFLRVGELRYDEKGQITFLRPLNSTHYSVYWTVPFDGGSEKTVFNHYFQPQLSKVRGYCTVDDFVGDWRVVFRGTEHPNLEFKITEQILPGDESSFEPVC